LGPIEHTALNIHLPLHRLAPHAACVFHTHMPYATALSMLENPRLEMAVQSALGFYDDIAYDLGYNGLALERAEGERMARVLGQKSVLMLGNHGALVIGAPCRKRSSACTFSNALPKRRCSRSRRAASCA
jgi:ribulose-5-phosphate 4-epimerase/fuculose-1-phosphate aldolase